MAEIPQSLSDGFLSGKPPQEEKRSLAPWITAGAVVLVLVAVLAGMGLRSKSGTVHGSTPDAYASQLALSQVELSQSSNMAGSQITYVDGEITNQGPATVVGVTVETTFLNNNGQPGQHETSPLSLIRTRDPYIDTEPVSASPLKPGEKKSFRLIFDHVSADWNQKNPQLQVVQVKQR